MLKKKSQKAKPEKVESKKNKKITAPTIKEVTIEDRQVELMPKIKEKSLADQRMELVGKKLRGGLSPEELGVISKKIELLNKEIEANG